MAQVRTTNKRHATIPSLPHTHESRMPTLRAANRPRTIRRRLVMLLIAISSVSGCYIAREPLLAAAAWTLTVDDAVGPADYLVVLGGSPEDRPFAAAELYRRGFAPKVVLFEYRPGLGGDPSQTELYARVLAFQGVPLEAVERIPGIVGSTWEEARSLRRFLEGRMVNRVVLVTSAEHTRRSRWAFRRALADLPVDIHTAAARHEDFDENNWWHDDDGVLLYAHEFLKFPYYIARYAIGRAE